jgi:hypothetical protein
MSMEASKNVEADSSDNTPSQGSTCSPEDQIEILRKGNYELAIMMQYFKYEMQVAVSCMEARHPKSNQHAYEILKDALIADFETMKDELDRRDSIQ